MQDFSAHPLSFCFLKRVLLGLACAILLAGATAVRAETWYFDFGPVGQQTTPNYNNVTNPDVHTLSGLIGASGTVTGAALAITVPFNTAGTNSNGTVVPAPEVGFPATATRDTFFGNVAVFQAHSAPTAQLQLSGLDPSLVYDFSIFASRTGVADNRQTEYQVTGANVATAYLNATENTSLLADVSGIQPRADGVIVIDVRPGPENNNANRFFYLGAMKVVSRSVAPPPPTCVANDDPALDNALIAYAPSTTVNGTTTVDLMGHFMYRPAGYSADPCKKWPLLVFLHGLGETVNGDKKGPRPIGVVNMSGLNSPGYQIKAGTAYSNQRPFLNGLILEPQSPGNWSVGAIDAIIEHAKLGNRVDEDRIYVTGLSLGGGATWAYAAANPLKVAAIVPIATTSSGLSAAGSASHVPVWAFHNFRDSNVDSPSVGPPEGLFRCLGKTPMLCTPEHVDRVIPFATTRVLQGYSLDHGATMAATDMTALLGGTGELLPTQWFWESTDRPQNTSQALMTLFADSGHNGWVKAYNNEKMWTWLYSQKRGAAPPKFSSRSISPATAAVNSGAVVTIASRIMLPGVPIVEVWADLKALGGSNSARMTLVSAGLYRIEHTLPISGLAVGVKPVAVIAIDANGNRAVQYHTFTLTAP
jgi:pimeloyl-ACP methyl ester carboxylesterase